VNIRKANRQGGSSLLEPLVALLIFSVGILAIVGMQAASIKLAGDAKYRTDASLLANQLIGEMWVGDRSAAALVANYSSPSGTTYAAWQNHVNTTLPGSAANPPTVTVDPLTSQVTVNLFWQVPGAPAHSHIVIAQIR